MCGKKHVGKLLKGVVEDGLAREAVGGHLILNGTVKRIQLSAFEVTLSVSGKLFGQAHCEQTHDK